MSLHNIQEYKLIYDNVLYDDIELSKNEISELKLSIGRLEKLLLEIVDRLERNNVFTTEWSRTISENTRDSFESVEDKCSISSSLGSTESDEPSKDYIILFSESALEQNSLPIKPKKKTILSKVKKQLIFTLENIMGRRIFF